MFQQPLGPNPVFNGMDWISHPTFNHSNSVVYLSIWPMMKMIVVWAQSWIFPRLGVQRKKDFWVFFFVFSKISLSYMCDFCNLNTLSTRIYLGMVKKRKGGGGREVEKEKRNVFPEAKVEGWIRVVSG